MKAVKPSSRDKLYLIMKKISSYIKDSLMWLWQFPQNLLAICIEGILCEAAYREGIVGGNTMIYNYVLPTMSLGSYIFVNTMSTDTAVKHSHGHSKQSRILGPLYLVVIGIPSLLHLIVYNICGMMGFSWNYYKFYTELWANKLAEKS